MNKNMRLNAANRRWLFNKRKWPYFFVAPFVIGYLVFNLFPTLYSFYISLFDWNGISNMDWVGIKNYVTIFTKDALYWKSLWNTLAIMLISVPFQIIIGLLLAQFTFQLKSSKGQRLTQTTIFMPYIISPVIIGVIFSYIFDWQMGYLNDILMRLGIMKEKIYWLQQPGNIKWIIGVMNVWRQSGYCMVIYLAAMTAISYEVIEAAKIDGANAVQTFLRVIVPQLRSITTFLILTSVINGLQLFEIPAKLYTGSGTAGTSIGGPGKAALTVIWKFYDNAFGSTMRLGYGAADLYVLFAIIVVLTICSHKLIQVRGE